jgi:hypothetical protein
VSAALSVGTAVGIVLACAATAAAESSATTTTSQLAAQSRTRIIVHPRKIEPGPNAKRHCVSWLAQENRASGAVITPQMHCWWQ